jgi:Kef-type K+ transport system membrane component KefB
LFLAIIGKELMVRSRQATVLGLLIAGVGVGNLRMLGFYDLDFVRDSPFLDMFSQFGVILLMFEAGLESSVSKMREVGVRAAVVACAGAAASLVLGMLAARQLYPVTHSYANWFVGVMIAATSVGVGAVVLKELKVIKTKTAALILGAATIDDVLCLIGLAVIVGMITGVDTGQVLSYRKIGFIFLKAIGFLGMAMMFGRWLSAHSFRLASKLQSDEVLLPVALTFCLIFSWIAFQFGLAPMIGAFAAGLVLEDVHYNDLCLREKVSDLDRLVKPIGMLFIPIFFVVVGSRVDLSVLLNLSALKVAAVFIVVAVVGKMACGLGTIGNPCLSWAAVTAGMIPRGEVVVVVAAQGSKLVIEGQPVVPSELFSAMVIVVLVTTMMAPPLLKWFLAGRSNQLHT